MAVTMFTTVRRLRHRHISQILERLDDALKLSGLLNARQIAIGGELYRLYRSSSSWRLELILLHPFGTFAVRLEFLLAVALQRSQSAGETC
jgi:hypothetical protein